MLVRNPLPLPDHGARLFAVSAHAAQEAFPSILNQTGLMTRLRFTARTSDQTLESDSATAIHRRSGDSSFPIGQRPIRGGPAARPLRVRCKCHLGGKQR